MAVELDPSALPEGLVSDWVGEYLAVNPNCTGCEDPTGTLEIEAVLNIEADGFDWSPFNWLHNPYGEFPPPNGYIELVGQEQTYLSLEDVCVGNGCTDIQLPPDIALLGDEDDVVDVEAEPASVHRWWTLVEPDSLFLGSVVRVVIAANNPATPLPWIKVIAVDADSGIVSTPATAWDTDWRPNGWSTLGQYDGGLAELVIDGVMEESYAHCLTDDSRLPLEGDGCHPVIRGGDGVWIGVIIECDEGVGFPMTIEVERVSFESH